MSPDRQFVAAALLLVGCTVWSGCENGRSVTPRSRSVDAGSDPADVNGPVAFNCSQDQDCPANLPACVAGRCRAAADGGLEDAAGGSGDAGTDAGSGPLPGQLCGPCQGRDEECGGVDNLCVPYSNGQSYCAQSCAGDAACPAGFVCLDSFSPAQCMPRAQRCVENCAVAGCAEAGDICDRASGACRTPKGHCEPCSESSECGLGLCATLNDGQRHCLAGCPEGQRQCPDETSCQPVAGQAGVACIPAAGECDLCGGVACEQGQLCAAGECVECLEDGHCEPGVEVCINRRCEQGAGGGGCRSDQECEGDADGNYCSGGRCVGCVVDEDCPPRNRCTAASVCESAPCLGVECAAPTSCDPASGRCVGEDGRSCPDLPCPEEQLCDAETGQCYNADGSCDAGSPCRPGSVCGGGGGLPIPGGGGAEDTRCSCPIPGPLGCTADADCTSPFRCRETAFGNVCGDPCAAENDCPEAWTCRLDFPVGCDSGATYCHPGQSCNAFTGACE